MEGEWASIGVECDLYGTGINGSNAKTFRSLLGVPTSSNGFMVHHNIDWLASIRGRLGTTWQSSLLYVTAGGAWEKMASNLIINGAAALGSWDIATPADFTHTQAGFVVGGGIESSIATNWTVRAEYLFYDFKGTHDNRVAFTNCETPGCGINTSTQGNNVNEVRLGVNYKI